jgi:HEAT repeat protein
VGSADAAQALTTALEDPSGNVRSVAEWALGALDEGGAAGSEA